MVKISGGEAAGAVTEYGYGALGRRYLEYGGDGAWNTRYLTTARSGCPAAFAAYREDNRSAGGGERQVCYDKLGREVRRRTRGFGASQWYAVDTEYDVSGRVRRVSEPYIEGATPHWTANEYNLLGTARLLALIGGASIMSRLIILLLMLQGCIAVTECDYELVGNGWNPAGQVPQKLINEENKYYKWFINANGDFLACPDLIRKGLCGGLYATYEKKADGSYEYDLIVCIE